MIINAFLAVVNLRIYYANLLEYNYNENSQTDVLKFNVDMENEYFYNNRNWKQWNIWGMDNAGFITAEGDKQYYLKDHLGSVRAVIDDAGSLISAQDYDAWGYQLQNRNFESDVSIFKFTGKERDEENKYDYFGARYYDARIGRWGQVEPLLDKYPSLTPYNYSVNNPMIIIDPNGEDPRRDQMANMNEVTALMREHINQPAAFFIYDLRGTEGPRYIYTKKDGFIDLVHFFAAAYVSSVFDLSTPQEIANTTTKLLGELLECYQTIDNSSSAWDKEDLRSNATGAEFGNDLNIFETYFITETYINKFEKFVIERGIINKDDPSISSNKTRIIESDIDKPLGQKFDYSPYRGNTVARKAELR